MLATGDAFGVARLWSTSTWEIVAELRAPEPEKRGNILQLQFSPRGDRLVALHYGYAEA